MDLFKYPNLKQFLDDTTRRGTEYNWNNGTKQNTFKVK